MSEIREQVQIIESGSSNKMSKWVAIGMLGEILISNPEHPDFDYGLRTLVKNMGYKYSYETHPALPIIIRIGERALPLLHEKLHRVSNPARCIEAIGSILEANPEIPKASSIQDLIPFLAHMEDHIHYSAKAALIQIGPESIPRLIEALDARSVDFLEKPTRTPHEMHEKEKEYEFLRVLSVESLGVLCSRPEGQEHASSAIIVLKKRVGDAKLAVRLSALRGLGYILKSPVGEAFIPQEMPFIISLIEDSKVEISKMAANLSTDLCKTESGKPFTNSVVRALSKAGRSKDEGQMAVAVSALREISKSEDGKKACIAGISALRHALDSSSKETIESAQRALINIGAPSLPEMRRALTGTPRKARNALYVISEICKNSGEEYVDFALDCFEEALAYTVPVPILPTRRERRIERKKSASEEKEKEAKEVRKQAAQHMLSALDCFEEALAYTVPVPILPTRRERRIERKKSASEEKEAKEVRKQAAQHMLSFSKKPENRPAFKKRIPSLVARLGDDKETGRPLGVALMNLGEDALIEILGLLEEQNLEYLAALGEGREPKLAPAALRKRAAELAGPLTHADGGKVLAEEAAKMIIGMLEYEGDLDVVGAASHSLGQACSLPEGQDYCAEAVALLASRLADLKDLEPKVKDVVRESVIITGFATDLFNTTGDHIAQSLSMIACTESGALYAEEAVEALINEAIRRNYLSCETLVNAIAAIGLNAVRAVSEHYFLAFSMESSSFFNSIMRKTLKRAFEENKFHEYAARALVKLVGESEIEEYSSLFFQGRINSDFVTEALIDNQIHFEANLEYEAFLALLRIGKIEDFERKLAGRTIQEIESFEGLITSKEDHTRIPWMIFDYTLLLYSKMGGRDLIGFMNGFQKDSVGNKTRLFDELQRACSLAQSEQVKALDVESVLVNYVSSLRRKIEQSEARSLGRSLRRRSQKGPRALRWVA